MQPLDRIEDQAIGETPEDVAILYSWANLEGAKYRDFSANRREYRAQMRHRAAEQLRLMELRAQSEAEAAAAEAEAEAAAAHAEADAASVKLAASRTMQAATAPVTAEDEQVEHMRKSSLREAAQQARRAAAERLEAARRAEAAALADSIARREEREIAEAQASALRQAAQYAEAEMRSRGKKASQPENTVPGRISDPYGPQVVAEGEYFERPGTPVSELEASRFRQQREYIEQNTGVELPEFRMPQAFVESASEALPTQAFTQQQRGYRPDEPSGGLASHATDNSLTGHAPVNTPADFEPRRHPKPIFEERHLSIARDAHRLDEVGALQLRREEKRAADQANGSAGPQARVVVPSIPYKEFRRVTGGGAQPVPQEGVSRLPELPVKDDSGAWRAAESKVANGHLRRREPETHSGGLGSTLSNNSVAQNHNGSHHAESAQHSGSDLPAHQNGKSGASRIPQDFRYRPATDMDGAGTRARTNGNGLEPTRDSWGVAWDHPDPGTDDARIADVQPTWSSRPTHVPTDPLRVQPVRSSVEQPPADASGPAWLYPKAQLPRFVDSLADSGVRRRAQLAAQSLHVGSGQIRTEPARETATQPRSAAAENTLPQSREQVASRWFALKGVFAKAGREQTPERQAMREKKRDTPFVVVYSLAGGVGKTSLVATLGRALSSLGEKVLLTDTTSQGLLPFYFGARELHAGVVRTFSPPSGSSDAPVHLVSYDFAAGEQDTTRADSEPHGEALEDLLANSQRANRVFVDLNLSCGWMLRRLAWMKPTVLIPLAADMNSVISLHAVERSFSGLKDADGKALEPIYLLNQFDASLPLHLDVREVLKQQLGDRLLPFVIRRAASVSEALAEGMTIVDYDAESEVARDYMGVANWLRNASAPAAVGLRNLRWSER